MHRFRRWSRESGASSRASWSRSRGGRFSARTRCSAISKAALSRVASCPQFAAYGGKEVFGPCGIERGKAQEAHEPALNQADKSGNILHHGASLARSAEHAAKPVAHEAHKQDAKPAQCNHEEENEGGYGHISRSSILGDRRGIPQARRAFQAYSMNAPNAGQSRAKADLKRGSSGQGPRGPSLTARRPPSRGCGQRGPGCGGRGLLPAQPRLVRGRLRGKVP